MDELYKKQLEGCVGSFRSQLAKFRVGRASVELIENVDVLAYGGTMPLKQLAGLSAPEPRSLLVEPWDKSLLPQIERAIREAGLGLSPVVDGEKIRVTVPQLTQERRLELVKLLNLETENARVCVRTVREDAMKAIERREESGEISEDAKFRERDLAQKEIETTNKNIEEIRADKERDITTLS